jgi:hypothetical protein
MKITNRHSRAAKEDGHAQYGMLQSWSCLLTGDGAVASEIVHTPTRGRWHNRLTVAATALQKQPWFGIG